jgi:sec-independent protein translocase protein TatA
MSGAAALNPFDWKRAGDAPTGETPAPARNAAAEIRYHGYMNLGMPEMIFLVVIALLLFGPKKLPEIGRTIGKAMGEFKRASHEFQSQLNEEVRQLEIETELKDLKELGSIRPAEGSESRTTSGSEPETEPAPASSDPSIEPLVEPAIEPENWGEPEKRGMNG